MTSQDGASPGVEPVVSSQSGGSKPSTTTAGLGAQIGIWILVLVLAMLAGAAAWRVGESTLDYFKPSEAASANYRDTTDLNREMPRVKALNGALHFGVLGGLLGLALGLAGGLSRWSLAGALSGALAGLILGTAAGALPSFVVMPWDFEHRHDDPSKTELLMPMLVHMGLWSGAGLAAGLAFGIGAYGFKPLRLFETALAGLIGAMLGTFVYELAGAILFPLARTANPFSETAGTRLLARLCVAGFVSLGAIRSLPSRRAAPDR
jgi:hypothetical protein